MSVVGTSPLRVSPLIITKPEAETLRILLDGVGMVMGVEGKLEAVAESSIMRWELQVLGVRLVIPMEAAIVLMLTPSNMGQAVVLEQVAVALVVGVETQG